jgi:hypothetical protein
VLHFYAATRFTSRPAPPEGPFCKLNCTLVDSKVLPRVDRYSLSAQESIILADHVGISRLKRHHPHTLKRNVSAPVAFISYLFLAQWANLRTKFLPVAKENLQQLSTYDALERFTIEMSYIRTKKSTPLHLST